MINKSKPMNITKKKYSNVLANKNSQKYMSRKRFETMEAIRKKKESKLQQKAKTTEVKNFENFNLNDLDNLLT